MPKSKKFQVICPYCSAEHMVSFDLSGMEGMMRCNKCNKEFKFAFGIVISATGFTGYVAKQGYLRMIINNNEEEFTWRADSGINLKNGDTILVLWKKRFFDKDKPHSILNFKTGVRTLL
jgi:predicted Zn finger-like uncharacterized protein